MDVREASREVWSGPPPEIASAVLTVDLDALAHNWRLLAMRAGLAACGAAVKADAYGIGLEPAVAALAYAGCRTFFVAHPGEGARARGAAPQADIYVLNGYGGGARETFREAKLRPVLGSTEEIADYAAARRADSFLLPPAIHVDTGMNRLGLSAAEVPALAGRDALKPLAPALLMTHFASSEDLADPITLEQVNRFIAARAWLPGVACSIANSSAMFRRDVPMFDLARPGYALYGGNPVPGQPNPMRPVVRLEATILQVRTVADGEGVGYNSLWRARGPRRLATIGVGYADGYPRSAAGTDEKAAQGIPAGEAIVGGVRCPFAGRVSMDLIVIDVSGAPDAAVARGAPVVLIGDGLDVDEVGLRSGTIGYEVLTRLGPRYARRYLGG